MGQGPSSPDLEKDLEFNSRHARALCSAGLGKSPPPAGSFSSPVAPPDCCAGAQGLGQVTDTKWPLRRALEAPVAVLCVGWGVPRSL